MCGSGADAYDESDSEDMIEIPEKSEMEISETNSDAKTGGDAPSQPDTRHIAAASLIATGVALLAAPFAVPAVAVALGFGSTGIIAGSLAAGFMSSYGGMVSAGSSCAILQSIGATGTFAGAGLIASSGAALSASGVALGPGPSAAVHIANEAHANVAAQEIANFVAVAHPHP